MDPKNRPRNSCEGGFGLQVLLQVGQRKDVLSFSGNLKLTTAPAVTTQRDNIKVSRTSTFSKCALAMADSHCWRPFNFFQNCGHLSLSRHPPKQGLCHILLEKWSSNAWPQTPRCFFRVSFSKFLFSSHLTMVPCWWPSNLVVTRYISFQANISPRDCVEVETTKAVHHHQTAKVWLHHAHLAQVRVRESGTKLGWGHTGTNSEVAHILIFNKVDIDMINRYKQQTMLFANVCKHHEHMWTPCSNQTTVREGPQDLAWPVNTIWPSLEQNPSPTPQTPGKSCLVSHSAPLSSRKINQMGIQVDSVGYILSQSVEKCLSKHHLTFLPQVLELQLFDSGLAISVVPEVHVRWSDIWKQLHLQRGTLW